jgi:hypothetical protein
VVPAGVLHDPVRARATAPRCANVATLKTGPNVQRGTKQNTCEFTMRFLFSWTYRCVFSAGRRLSRRAVRIVACAGNVGHGLPNTPLLRRDARRVHKGDRVRPGPRPAQGSSMNAPHPEFVRDEVIVCMLMAVCIGRILGIIYSVMT